MKERTHTLGQTSSRELKEVTYECAMVPVTGIPNRKPAWTLLVRSNPGRQIIVSAGGIQHYQEWNSKHTHKIVEACSGAFRKRICNKTALLFISAMNSSNYFQHWIIYRLSWNPKYALLCFKWSKLFHYVQLTVQPWRKKDLRNSLT